MRTGTILFRTRIFWPMASDNQTTLQMHQMGVVSVASLTSDEQGDSVTWTAHKAIGVSVTNSALNS